MGLDIKLLLMCNEEAHHLTIVFQNHPFSFWLWAEPVYYFEGGSEQGVITFRYLPYRLRIYLIFYNPIIIKSIQNAAIEPHYGSACPAIQSNGQYTLIVSQQMRDDRIIIRWKACIDVYTSLPWFSSTAQPPDAQQNLLGILTILVCQ